jgi:predicted ATP-binding protein involved in virulence
MDRRIKEIRVLGLFGMFDHVIPLKLDTRLTIVYGENGIGKTMLFRILHALFSKDFKRLNNLPFRKLELSFEDGEYMHVRREEGKMWVSLNGAEEEGVSFVTNKETFKSEFLEKVSNLSKREQELVRSFLDRKINEKLSEKPLGVRNYTSKLMGQESLEGIVNILPPEIILQFFEEEEIFKKFLSEPAVLPPSNISDEYFQLPCYLIGTNRLLYADDKIGHQSSLPARYQHAISVYSREMAALIKEKHEEYQKTSDQLELSLRKRLSSGELNQDFSARQLRDLSEQVTHRRKELRDVGLWDEQDEDPAGQLESLSEVHRAILGVNLIDTQAKLGVFDELYERIHLFVEIINKRRFSYKTLSIRPGKGFVVTNANKEPLSLNDLSSGEQHELVLLFQLLFKVPPKSLILIDEPEISLHIAWQKAFIDDMLEIIRLRDLDIDIMVATHSPSIINGRWDEHTVALKGNVLVNG